MRFRHPISLATTMIVAAMISVTFAEEDSVVATSSATQTVRTLLEEHCVHCHEATEDEPASGNVDLHDFLVRLDRRSVDPQQCDDILNVLMHREMPPAEESMLEPASRNELVASVSTLLRETLRDGPPPHSDIRRLNRLQYNNAVRELLGLQCEVFSLPERVMREHRGYFQPASGRMPKTVHVGCRPLGKSQMIEPRLAGVAAFPQDLRAEHGYDTQADHLSMSPLLMESFLKLGRSIVESPSFHRKNVSRWKEYFGPLAKPSLEDDPVIEAEVRRRIESLTSRAFRRPASAATTDRYAAYALRTMADGETIESAMKDVVAAVIASPKFLYLAGTDASLQVDAPESAHELAQRLSFFLWASAPDDALLAEAASGELLRPDVLAAETDRMLADRRLKGFCDSFPSQWLQLDRIISATPDPQTYPGFYFSKYRDSMHMILEPLLLFETVLIENRPIDELIAPEFTYRSHHLRRSYGESLPSDIKKKRFGEVTVLTFDRLPTDDPRYGGVITNAAVMTMTSGPLRTQPITRGAWIASVIFGDPPKPPPADVPPLDELDENDDSLTLRERLAVHRERSDCRGCHEQLDPLGFALENYNVIGRWRDRYASGSPVDASGTLFGTDPFRDPIEFKQAILRHRDRFARAFIEHLCKFALARPIVAADRFEIDQIVAQSASDDYRMQSVLHAIIQSRLFRGHPTTSDGDPPRTLASQTSPFAP